MGVAGIGSAINSLGATYNFTSMTNQQFLTAVEQLGSAGKISQTDEGQLAAIAQGVDYTPIDRASVPSEQQIMSDPTEHNFLSEVENIDWSVNHIAGSVGAPLYNSMLQDLETYQGTPVEQNGSQSISVQA
jgi:hypothetical protein